MIDPIRSAALRYAQSSALQHSSFAPFGPGGATGGASFGDTLKGALEEISSVQEGAQEVIQTYLSGGQVELHEVMAATEEAGIALELLVEMRGKLTEAYRTLINMQS